MASSEVTLQCSSICGLHDISTFGRQVDWLFEVIFWIVMVVWIAVMIAMVIFHAPLSDPAGRKAEFLRSLMDLTPLIAIVQPEPAHPVSGDVAGLAGVM